MAKILVVSDELGWPLVTGLRRRTAQSVSALESLGDVTWVACPRSTSWSDPFLPSEFHSVSMIVLPVANLDLKRTAWRWLSRRVPWALAGADWTEAEEYIESLANEEFDLVWAMNFGSFLALRRAAVKPRHFVIDTDIESEKLRLRLDSGHTSGVAKYVRWIIGKIDLRHWRRLERLACEGSSAVSVCSAEEAAYLPHCTTWITPNSYPDPGPQTLLRAKNHMLFVGSLDYAPNIEGLEFFVRYVLRELRRERPDLLLRVVGRNLSADHWLRSEPAVEILANVGDIGPEVAQATMVVVPLFWGGGTRLKIVEAFAYRTPVVSTTIGATGLGASSGRELVLADDGPALVRACALLLDDPQERERLASAGRSLFERDFDSATVERDLSRRISQLLA